ncbi:MAG: hypothetical protein KF729_22860 [Sandaracinaceae bacterium]|nr:hypothetical protein [Sandaracinaceae bacterium]
MTRHDDSSAGYGLLIFLADWLRYPAFRHALLAPGQGTALVQRLRDDYHLTDAEIGVLVHHDRPGLVAAVGRILHDLDLDHPPAWTGAPPPGSARPDDVWIMWPGSSVVAIAAVTSVGGPLVAGQPAELAVTGWNLEQAAIRFRLDGHPALDASSVSGQTDANGFWTGRVRVTFPHPGAWMPYAEVAGVANDGPAPLDVR